MIAALVFCLCLTAEPQGTPGPLGASPERVLFNTVWNALQANPELANQHRGYLSFLEGHPEIASPEEAYSDLTTLSPFHAIASGFDEALQRDPALQNLFDRYYARIAADPMLRRSIDSLYRAEMTEPALQRNGAAMTYLRAHPDMAMRFLENPARATPVPEDLYGLRAFFKEKPEVREELLTAFRRISENAAAHADVFPWWQAAAEPEREGAKSYRQLMDRLVQRPHEFWIWHNRAAALAAQPHARDWIRYWQRNVRRNAELAPPYAEYLKQTRAKPEWRKAALNEWRKTLGPTPAWPPEGPPPELTPLPRIEPSKAKHPSKQDLMPKAVPRPKRPEKPPVPVPQKPEMPAKPTVPEKQRSAERTAPSE